MKKYLIFIALTAISFTGYSKNWTISDSNLEIRFDDQTALIRVTDKRCNKVWEQLVLTEQYTVKKTAKKDNSLIVSLTGKCNFEASFTLTATSALEVSISADEKMAFDEISFPSAFKAPDKNHYVLITDSEGMLLPVSDTEYPMSGEKIYYCGGGMVMAWMGVTDTQFETGYMAILETPFDGTLRTKRENGMVTFEPVWVPTMGHFGYSRKLTYHFFDKGGYVAQCKTYREYAWKKNSVITLKEKQKRFPAIAKMLGCPHIYVWDNAREVSFAKEMKAAGVNKAFILWNPNHPPYPQSGYDTYLKELGYAAGVYELCTDIHMRDTAMYKVDETGPLRFRRTGVYPGLFNEIATKTKDGKTYSNQFGHTICPVAVRPELTKRIERELKEYPHESYFLDVYQANGMFECYSPKHRLDRRQYAAAIIENFKMIEDKYNQFMGGEWGSDFTGSSSIYAHGMMTIQRTWWGTESGNKNTIYYSGNWRNSSRPTQMLGSRVAPLKYLKYSISEKLRVPLFELVYHDAIVTSWRWEDANHHMPEIWWKKDLFNILYGSAPLWVIDRDRWVEWENTFIDSYNTICPWLQQIAYDEMVSHRFVTEDHKVQESVFSSGKKVMVNFGDEPIVIDGKEIRARGMITLNN
ncbi:MAG: DUF5696 domain-containing protein [Salinivirgaceae bacterium]|jgi:hypothetical protein|nr:DUF5696 domain-containing protein [Salinivirgaceae bacterium]